MSDLKSKTIGGFKILQEIQVGFGSQGAVYKAVCFDARDNLVPVGTIVALKVMAVQDDGRKRWKRLEKRTADLVRMVSPNVVRYYGCFSEAGLFNDVHVVVQEFLSGETLKERLLRFPSGLDVDEVLRIADEALAGLVYTSSCGIIHRDIKPGNIFLCDDGAVKLIDFEIAKQDGGTTTTSDGNIRGSFDYMAPDFTDVGFHGDVRSDVFSMGVVLHEMLTGKTPYQRLEGDNKQANFAFLSRWARSLADGCNPIHVSSRINRLLAHTEEVMTRSLAPRREDRYADFVAFREGLKNVRYRNLRNGKNVYQMLQYVGKGGFGEVFKARLLQTGQLVAVKHLLKAAYAERFCREAKVMKKLRDSASVQYVDFFTMDVSNGREAFLVMTFLDGMPGSSLRDAIRKAGSDRIPRADVFKAFERYARGLQTMHAAGVFHRDIKPSNLYFPAGRPGDAVIMDLGIARDVNGTETHGLVPGTLDYMPPEVVVSNSRGDGGMDIYALGLCFYEALTCKMAFPRLPKGAASYAAFFKRAKSGQKPAFDDPEVSGDGELLALLTDMTNPELVLRLRDAGELLRRIRDMRKRRYPDSDETAEESFGVAEQAAEDDIGPATVAPTIALDGETTGTAATQWGGLEALERERQLAQGRRRDESQKRAMRVAWSVLVFSLVVLAVGAGLWFARRPVLNYYAERRLDKVLDAYRSGDEQAAWRGEIAWRAQWSPESSGWLTLDAESFSSLTGKLDSARKEMESGRVEREKAARIGRQRQEALKRIDGCRAASGRLNEAKFKELDKWALPEGVVDDEEVKLRLSELGKCVAATVADKLSVEPPQTRGTRIDEARAILRNAWAAKILPQAEQEGLAREIETVSSWCVVVVKNGCGSSVRLDGRDLAVGSQGVAVYKDGRSENGVLERKGYKSVKLPPGLNGRTFEVVENLFVANPIAVEFPRPADGVKCFFRGKDMSPGEIVQLDPGDYSVTYRWEDKYKPQTASFSVRVNVATAMPQPGPWEFTEEYIASEKARKERERIRLETPVDVVIAEFGSDVTLVLDGEKQSSGVIRLKPGEYDYRYSKPDCVSHEGKLTVSPGVAAKLPGPGEWKKTPEAIERERQAKLKAARDLVVDSCKALMAEKPIKTRQARLSEAMKALTKAVEVDQVMTKDDARDLKAEIERRQRWVVCEVRNAIPKLAMTVGGRRVEAGKTESLVFKEGLPKDWSCKVEGYETKELDRDADGRTLEIGEGDLTVKAVQVSLPKLGAGESCYYDGSRVDKPLSLKPGTYSCVYRRAGYEEQVKSFEIPFGKPCTLPPPGDWKALPVKVSLAELPADAVCQVDGKTVRSALTLFPGTYSCEYRRPDYKVQTKSFEVAVATPMTIPAAGEWEPSQGLKSLNSAERHAQEKDWAAAEQDLAKADVSSEDNRKRKTALEALVRKQTGLRERAEKAVEYYDNEYYGETVKYYYEACKLGYLMTDEDKRRAKHAYTAKRKDLKALIDWTKREILRGRSVDRSIPDLETEAKTLFEWYNGIK